MDEGECAEHALIGVAVELKCTLHRLPYATINQDSPPNLSIDDGVVPYYCIITEGYSQNLGAHPVIPLLLRATRFQHGSRHLPPTHHPNRLCLVSWLSPSWRWDSLGKSNFVGVGSIAVYDTFRSVGTSQMESAIEITSGKLLLVVQSAVHLDDMFKWLELYHFCETSIWSDFNNYLYLTSSNSNLDRCWTNWTLFKLSIDFLNIELSSRLPCWVTSK